MSFRVTYQLVFWQRKWIADRIWKLLEDLVYVRIHLVGRTRHILLGSIYVKYPKAWLD